MDMATFSLLIIAIFFGMCVCVCVCWGGGLVGGGSSDFRTEFFFYNVFRRQVFLESVYLIVLGYLCRF